MDNYENLASRLSSLSSDSHCPISCEKTCIFTARTAFYNSACPFHCYITQPDSAFCIHVPSADNRDRKQKQ
ncbi:hypothetical protein NC651_022072 [Populus alba x Populus x berolinensis]|nr:hypothetical protein NC651_022060 [Populus alba x Populus x berolinensis]KAJ6895735.1 hypothetical protein NC651_022072 [Populus alba x Populus x berolinensis]